MYAVLNLTWYVLIGLKDVSNLNPETSLADLGLDSLMGVEIKQLLERDFEVSLSTREIRMLNLKKIEELSKSSLVITYISEI